MRRITATLGIRRRIEGAEDRYGNPVEAWSDPEPWPVYAVGPRASDEPWTENRDPNVAELTVFAPVDGPRPGPLDRVVVDGLEWDVDGRPGEWDRNPHVEATRQRGIVVNLERKEG